MHGDLHVVLTGAIKLFREDHGLGADHFRHHTVLVHEVGEEHVHRRQAELINAISAPRGLPRLGRAGTARRSCRTSRTCGRSARRTRRRRRSPYLYADIAPYIGIAAMRIEDSIGSPVVVINGDKEIEQRTPTSTGRQKVWADPGRRRQALAQASTIERLHCLHDRLYSPPTRSCRWVLVRLPELPRPGPAVETAGDEGGRNGPPGRGVQAICRARGGIFPRPTPACTPNS